MKIRNLIKKIEMAVLSLILAGNLYFATPNYAQESKLRIKEEVTFVEEEPNYLSIISLENKDFKLGIRDISSSTNTTFGLKSRIHLNDKSDLEATVLGDNDNKLKTRLEARLNENYHLGFVYGKSDSDKLRNIYSRFESNGNVLGLSYSEFNGKKEVNYFGVLDWKNAPLVKELLLSAGTSGTGNDNYFAAFRVPSIKGKTDFGYEGFAIFDRDELQFYKFRFAHGKARMGAIGHHINIAGTGPRVADIDTVNSVISETDLFYPLALELWERGEHGIEISGKDNPKIEVIWNPKRKGDWIGAIYDTEKNKLKLEGGINIHGLQLKAVSDLKNRHVLRIEKGFRF